VTQPGFAQAIDLRLPFSAAHALQGGESISHLLDEFPYSGM
jgi:hypothetical protein